jgi:NADH-quinone oxidoreductase subunit G
LFKKLFYSIGCSNLNYSCNYIRFADSRFSFQLNETFIGLELKTIFLFLGTNIRLEIPLLNARIRKLFLLKQEFNAYSLGLGLNHLTFPVKNLGILPVV